MAHFPEFPVPAFAEGRFPPGVILYKAERERERERKRERGREKDREKERDSVDILVGRLLVTNRGDISSLVLLDKL